MTVFDYDRAFSRIDDRRLRLGLVPRAVAAARQQGARDGDKERAAVHAYSGVHA